jgi:predicted dienelactone hydrolase
MGLKMNVKHSFVIFLVLCVGFCLSWSHKGESSLELPEPTGSFSVGTAWFYFTDSSRPETFTQDPDDFRKLAVRVWYPAEIKKSDQPCPYAEHTVVLPAKEISDEIRASLEKLNERLNSIKTQSYKNAKPALSNDPFPVVLYSHGYWAGMNQSTILMEELASHGFLAASIGHSFETNSVTKPDGSVIRFNPLNPELKLRNLERQKALLLERAITQTSDPGELDSLFHKIMEARPKMQESIAIWVNDISFIIDKFVELNQEHEIFKNKLDLKHIGLIGHSFGGAASGQACLTDPRITAGINMDGLQVGDMIEKNIKKPFLFMHHDNPHALNNTPNINLFQRAQGPAYLIVIEGSGHYNFSDFSLPIISEVAPVPKGTLGNIDGMRFIEILNDGVLTFLNLYLKNEQSRSMEKISQKYPEIKLKTNNIQN